LSLARRHQQDPLGISALDDQMGDSVGEGVGFPGPSSGDDQPRRRRRRSSGQSENSSLIDLVVVRSVSRATI